jgi:hypothetical protein
MSARTTSLPLFLSLGAITAAVAGAQTPFITDDFETDTSANYTIVDDGAPNGTQMFAFDYGAAGIPTAPRSAPGTSKGLRLTANDSIGAVDGWSLFHNTTVSDPHYRLIVDAYMNYIPGSFTTEHAHVGIGGNGTTLNQYSSPTSGSGAFLAFTGDGGSASDYRWFRDPVNTPVGETDMGLIPATHPSYLGHGANASDPFYLSLFPSPPATAAGSPGNIWTTITIDVNNTAGVIEFYFDGTLVFQGNFAGSLDGKASLGLCDIFASVSGTLDVYTLYDNFVVEPVTSSGIGTNYCTAVANSTGTTGVLSAIGSPIALNNNVTLTASSLPNNAFGFFLTSATQGFVQNPGGSQGNLCVSGSIGRYVGPGQIQNSGMAGAFSLAIDLTQHPTPNGFVVVQAGQTWNFQAWHRDFVGGVPTSNFTDGLSIAFN